MTRNSAEARRLQQAGIVSLFVLDGVAQAGGLAMLISGLAAQQDVVVRTGGVELLVAPTVGRSGGRLGLGGAF